MLNVWKLAVRVAARFILGKSPRLTAAYLTPASHLELIRWWTSHIGPTLDREIAEHMTIAFKPRPEEVEAFVEDRPVKLHVVGYVQDERSQAVLIRPSDVESSNLHPHITISVSDGTPAVYSNELLARGKIHPVSGPTLDAVLGIEWLG